MDANPTMVISVHQNYYPSQSQRGAQVFYDGENEKSKLLAGHIQSQMNDLYKKQGVKNRVAAQGDFFMLRCAPCASVIVECGFLSNAKDEGLLSQKGWREKTARSIASGVMAYLAGTTA